MNKSADGTEKMKRRNCTKCEAWGWVHHAVGVPQKIDGIVMK